MQRVRRYQAHIKEHQYHSIDVENPKILETAKKQTKLLILKTLKML